MVQRRTDLAAEAHELWRESAGDTGALPGVRVETDSREGFERTVVTVLDREGAEKLGKPVGTYVTLELEGLLRREEDAFERAARAIADEVESMVPHTGTALVVGLGNRAVTPDLVGPLAVERLLVTRHLVESVPEHFGHLRAVAATTPGVLAATGVESAETVSALVRAVSPSCVIAVDALASRSIHRLCRTVQLADTGIVPGSGVGNHRGALNRETLGVPVIAVGVPTVVDGATLALDLLAEAGKEELGEEALAGQGGDFFVTPRDVDCRVADLAKVIGYGVSMGLNPSLTPAELTLLLE